MLRDLPLWLVSTLLECIAGLIGNYICHDVLVADVTVVTPMHISQARNLAAQTTAVSADTTDDSHNGDNVNDLSPLFDEAADQPPPSVELLTETAYRSAAGRPRSEGSVSFSR